MRTSIFLSSLFIANAYTPYVNWSLLFQVLIFVGLGYCALIDLSWLGHQTKNLENSEEKN